VAHFGTAHPSASAKLLLNLQTTKFWGAIPNKSELNIKNGILLRANFRLFVSMMLKK